MFGILDRHINRVIFMSPLLYASYFKGQSA